MRNATFVLKLLVYCYLTYLLYFLITGYSPAGPGYNPPAVIWILDTINLFIHEAGHFFMKPFWMWIYILGGSLLQLLIPLTLVLVSLRETPQHAVLPGFWLGENLVNVSAYIKDAPYMQLKLIARGAIHDWNWLIGPNEETASLLGGTVFGAGILIVAASLAFGAFWAVRDFRRKGQPEELA